MVVNAHNWSVQFLVQIGCDEEMKRSAVREEAAFDGWVRNPQLDPTIGLALRSMRRGRGSTAFATCRSGAIEA